MYGTPNFLTAANIAGSDKPPLTSLMIAAPACTAFSAVSARIVSMLIFTPCFESSAITGITRACSSSALTRSAPGLVDSPPISMMSTPSAIISRPRATPASKELWRPPSANESGVRFKIPMTNMGFTDL